MLLDHYAFKHLIIIGQNKEESDVYYNAALFFSSFA